MNVTTELPNDPMIPGLIAIRASGLARAIPALNLEGHPVELMLCGYTQGSRATLEARAGNRRLAVKAYADDPSPEAALYEALSAAGLRGDSGPRVPPLLAWERDLRVLVIGWLQGPTTHELIKNGQGKRAGQLAANWFQRMSSLSVKLGPSLGAAQLLDRAHGWVAALVGADSALGTAATALAGRLERTQPKEGAARLVHGTLYARHIFDLGDGPGVIDWQKFGQGPVEIDAAMFLATTWRLGLKQESLAREAARAEETFLAETAGLLDKRALAWHRAIVLLRLANKINRRPSDDWPARAHALLGEAARLALAAA
ncbi:MAG TPA: phosphotransferase [Verrucomicrobiae bacterium]|jgi:hypothetical protein